MPGGRVPGVAVMTRVPNVGVTGRHLSGCRWLSDSLDAGEPDGNDDSKNEELDGDDVEDSEDSLPLVGLGESRGNGHSISISQTFREHGLLLLTIMTATRMVYEKLGNLERRLERRIALRMLNICLKF